ncbi:hypothetical protein ACFQ0M_47900 [Kitasatospora aburaviensis]
MSLNLDTLTLLVVDSTTAEPDRTEGLWFVFYGGTLTGTQLGKAGIPAANDDIDNLMLAAPDDLRDLCAESHERIRAALDRITNPYAPVYLTNGQPPL